MEETVLEGNKINFKPYYKLYIDNSIFNFSCVDNYLEITDSLGSEIACGQERKIFVNKFCSNVIYISYKATFKPIINLYKGFKLYFEGNEIENRLNKN